MLNINQVYCGDAQILLKEVQKNITKEKSTRVEGITTINKLS